MAPKAYCRCDAPELRACGSANGARVVSTPTSGFSRAPSRDMPAAMAETGSSCEETAREDVEVVRMRSLLLAVTDREQNACKKAWLRVGNSVWLPVLASRALPRPHNEICCRDCSTQSSLFYATPIWPSRMFSWEMGGEKCRHKFPLAYEPLGTISCAKAPVRGARRVPSLTWPLQSSQHLFGQTTSRR